jgi:hypothetical protein
MKYKLNMVAGTLLSFIAAGTALASDYQNLEELINNRKEQTASFFKRLNYADKGLTAVAAAVEDGNYVQAAEQLLNYFDGRKITPGFQLGKSSDSNLVEAADGLLKDKLTLSNGIQGVLERNQDGNIIWNSLAGTDNSEWPCQISRHGCLLDALNAYRQTGKAQYLTFIQGYLWDWLVHNDLPIKEIERFSKGQWANNIAPQWRTLDSGIRARAWIKLWENWKGEPVNKKTRFLMLMSLLDHADYLRWHHRPTGNWKISEMRGLVEISIAFPEFADSNSWYEYAIGQLTEEIDNQFYPDGAQKELAFSYDQGVVRNFWDVADVVDLSPRKLPASFREKLENLYRYMAYVIKPNGCGPMNNDSDGKDYILPVIQRAAGQYGSDDLEYIASRGTKGAWKANSYSTVLPWAGQAIYRNGFAKDSDWSFFDVGPWGIGHQHNDKLHLSVVVGGREILVDSGRYTYNGYHDTSNIWRNYVTGSESHNVILIDGLGQSASEKEASKPLSKSDYVITDTFAFARGTYNTGFKGVLDKDANMYRGDAAHSRAVVYVERLGWVVVDHIKTDRPRKLDVLWRFHPDCLVKNTGQKVFTADPNKANLLIQPISANDANDWDIELVSGRIKPSVQGWYSETFNVKVPNTVAVYSKQVQGDAMFAWLLKPVRNDLPAIEVKNFRMDAAKGLCHIEFSQESGSVLKMDIPVLGGVPRIEKTVE